MSADELQPIRFQGQSFDEETGLHYNRFRYFDPDLGMFTTRDPIGLMGGNNVFQYAPNPVGWIDPFGLSGNILYHYTNEEGLKGILGSGEVRPSQGSTHARFGNGQYFTDIAPETIGGKTLKDVPAGSGKISLGQLSSNIYGDARKLNSISHVVAIDVTGLNIKEPRPNTFLMENSGNLDVSNRIVNAGETLGERKSVPTCPK